MQESLHRSDICMERRHRRSDTPLGMDPLAFDSLAWPTRTPPTDCRTSCAATRCGLDPELRTKRLPTGASRHDHLALPAANGLVGIASVRLLAARELDHAAVVGAPAVRGSGGPHRQPVRTSEAVAVVVAVIGVRGRSPVFNRRSKPQVRILAEPQ
jgi:hypothetical protein